MGVLSREQLNYINSMSGESVDVMEYMMQAALNKTVITGDDEKAFRAGYQACIDVTRFAMSKLKKAREGGK